jgi:hypothetical protein
MDGKAQFRWVCGEDPIPDNLPWRSFCGEMTDFFVDAGTTERWILESKDELDHPFHMHVNPFRTLSRADRVLPDKGKQIPVQDNIQIGNCYDTVLIPGWSRVTIQIHFKADLAGKTVFHCHNLQHEDNGMMAAFEIRKRGPGKKHGSDCDAPDWRLKDTEGNYYQLSDWAHKKLFLVLLRGLGCDHCRTQLEVLLSRYAELQNANYDIVAISAEPLES